MFKRLKRPKSGQTHLSPFTISCLYSHPPGGATALLAVTLPQVANLSWFYVGDILASSCIMLGWALIVNNIGHRRYPREVSANVACGRSRLMKEHNGSVLDISCTRQGTENPYISLTSSTLETRLNGRNCISQPIKTRIAQCTIGYHYPYRLAPCPSPSSVPYSPIFQLIGSSQSSSRTCSPRTLLMQRARVCASYRLSPSATNIRIDETSRRLLLSSEKG